MTLWKQRGLGLGLGLGLGTAWRAFAASRSVPGVMGRGAPRGRAPRDLVSAAAALIASAVVAQGLAAQNRPDVLGREAAVVAGHPLAALAGAEALRRGGNAVDAAITMAAVLAVVRPHMNGIGGDAFLMLRDGLSGNVRALNGSGRAGGWAAPEFFHARGLEAMPRSGLHSVTVPGAVQAWADALSAHGTITMAQALGPAISIAENGFAVSAKLAEAFAASRSQLEADSAMRQSFLPGGSQPMAGSILRLPDLAASLRLIAAEGPDALYVGELARRIDEFMAAEDGIITSDDLAAHSSTWQQPIWTVYGGHRVAAFPPNSQGMALLLAMNLAEQFDLRRAGHNSAAYIHALVEISKLAYLERDRHVTDPAFAEIPLDHLLSKEFARELAAELGSRATGNGEPGGDERDDGGDTVYLAAIDRDGNAVSMIQSLYSSFGSGRMVPGTGIVLHNRGALFSLDPEDINVVAPGKRTFHTLAPSLALREDGSLAMLFGTPGGDGQPQTLLQVFNNIVLFGMSPQQAVEEPRWRSVGSNRVLLEPGITDETRAALERYGHQVDVTEQLTGSLGGAQVILIDPVTGVRFAAADPRREAYAIAW